VLIFLGFLLSDCNKQTSYEKPETEVELDLMKSGSAYLENGNFTQAQELYLQFVENYPTHPYVDDAAYRLAYISVISDDKNPYYNYEKGLILFENFIENYPNSRYIIACQNWVNLLDTVVKLNEKKSTSKVATGENSSEINRLKRELKRVQAENAKLQNTLEELQKAIER
jgi:outer membrane protein assembly factor BamD (BamD/ComL family)